ncbi:MAG TPA: hypothetical protein VLC06_22200 [Polyangia bacterium]|jgi:hypothetical protein|nr:hypothetical protein [Polyangia bacterium]
MVKRRWIRESGLSAASVRFFVVTMAVALSFAPGRRGVAAVAAAPAARSEAPDGGVPRGVPRENGPAGAFLGPLKKPADSDPERHYPLKPGANGSLLYEAPQFSAEVAPDGTVTFHDRRIDYSARRSAFSFDLSDEFVREFAHGTSYPYAKANFLAATFKRRTAMAAEVNSRQMRAARTALPLQLDALWDDTRYRRRERRRIVFLLWQEVDKSSADGRSVAATIEVWIRRRLPRGSADAYNDQELDAYSHERRGDPVFDPYGSPLEMRSPAP